MRWWQLIYDLLKEVHFLLVGHLHVEDFTSSAILSSQLEHLYVIIEHILRQHAITKVFDLVLYT